MGRKNQKSRAEEQQEREKQRQSKREKKKAGKLEKALGNSFINYFSDLFIMAMVVAWIGVIVIMVVMAIYATIAICDTSMWSDLANLVAVPLTAGGAVWMVKNSVQHAIANNKGERAHMDFPRVPDTEDIEFEAVMAGETESDNKESEASG